MVDEWERDDRAIRERMNEREVRWEAIQLRTMGEMNLGAVRTVNEWGEL